MGGADPEQLPHALPDRIRYRSIVIGRIRPFGPNQNARIEGAADDDGNSPCLAGWKESVQGFLFQKRVATRQKETVEIARAHPSSQTAISFTPRPMAPT